MRSSFFNVWISSRPVVTLVCVCGEGVCVCVYVCAWGGVYVCVCACVGGVFIYIDFSS